VLLALARSRSGSPRDWAIAAVLWAFAVLVAAMASRKPLQATAAAVLAATAAAAISGRAGPLAASLGVECLLTELASGAVVLGAAWLALRGGTTALGRSASAAAAAGALAGGAALQVACAAHAAAPHLLVFHVGGVVAAALAASLVSPAPRYEAA
jgi:hypothetical protein